MRWTSLLLVLLVAGAARAATGDGADLPRAPIATARDYAGSESCRACHRAVYEQWAASGHSRAMMPPGPDVILGDFASGAKFESFGQWYRPHKDGADYMMDVPAGDGTRRQQRVDYVLGYRQVQMYLTNYEGRLHMLPLGWAVSKGIWEHSMENLNEFQHVGPDHKNFWANQGRIWDMNCEVCHHGVPTPTPQFVDGKPRLDIAHAGVGCETCHGPGKAHIELWRNMKPEEAGLRDRSIVNTARLDRDAGVGACVNCHTEYVHYFTDFNAGDDFYQSFKLLTFDDADVFWPDGRPRRHSTRLQGLIQSACFQQSNMQCTTCHAPHGSPHPRDLRDPADSDRRCIQCHAAQGVRISAHTRHAPDSPGSRCVNCHMPRLGLNYPNADYMRMHTIDVPLPELTRDYGVPNACTDCHADRDVEWAVRWRDRWWGPSDHWRKDWTEQISKAREDDPEAIMPLLDMLQDPGENPLMRASAAKFLGLLRSLDAVPVLIEVVQADPDPSVRVNAVDALRRLGPAVRPQAGQALRGALRDPNRIVRAEAAYALGRIQAVPWSGPDRAAYLAAAGEFERYLNNHAELADVQLKAGNLAFDQNRLEEAIAAYRAALAIHETPGKIKLVDPGLAYENIGSAHWARRRPGPAIEMFAKAVETQPDLYSARRKLAEAYKATGRLEEAVAQFAAMLERAPQDLRARLSLAEVYIRQGQAALAAEQVDAVLAARPDSAMAQRLRLQLEKEFGVAEN